MEDISENDPKVKTYEPKFGETMIPPPASHALAGDIRRALQQTPRLTIADLANRWPEHFRDGYLVVEICDADGFHEWPGVTDVGLLALDVLNAEMMPKPWETPKVPVALDAIECAASQQPATPSSLTDPNTPTTHTNGKQ